MLKKLAFTFFIAAVVTINLLLFSPTLTQRSSAEPPDLIYGYEVISDQTVRDDSDFKELVVTCPEGKVAIGGGAGIFYDNDDGYSVLPVLVSSFMYPDYTGWFAEGIQPASATTTWYIEVQVICAFVGNQ